MSTPLAAPVAAARSERRSSLSPAEIMKIARAHEASLSRLLMAYISSGLVFMLLPGTFLGVWNLLQISGRESVGSVSPAWLQAHGHAQVFGWIGSFIFGIGFYSIPKLRGAAKPAFGAAWACWAMWTQSGSTVTGTVVIAQAGGSQFFDVTGTMSGSTLWIAGPTQIPTSFTGVVTTNGSALAWSGTFIVSSPNLLSCGSTVISQGTFQGTGGLPSSAPTSADVTGSWTGTATNPACSAATFQWQASLTQSGTTVTGTLTIQESGGSQGPFNVTGILSNSTLWIAGPSQIPTSFTGIVTANGSLLSWSGTFIVVSPNLLSCGTNIISQGTFQGMN